MTVVPRALRWAVTALMVLLVGVAVAGSAAVSQVIIGATIGAIFLTIYLDQFVLFLVIIEKRHSLIKVNL